ncbi:hypothetical protein F4782DRAFT_527858 [Xylaria castorea]|nr:hypothetical protein F4782DRAFT_527858 [Xylaria castorea]
MRPNAAISGLLACSVGITAAGTIEGLALREDPGTTAPSPNSVITVKKTFPDLSSQPAIQRMGVLTFWFETNGAEINTVRLKIFNANATGPGNGDSDELITDTAFHSSGSTSDTDGEVMLNSGPRGTGPDFTSLLNPMPDNSLLISWGNSDHNITDQPLYLEFEWTRSPSSGNSTTQLFAVYDSDSSAAIDSLDDARNSSNTGDPARQEISTVIPTSPTPSNNPEASTSPASGTASQPAATVGPESSSSSSSSSTSAPNGLDRNGIIGVAVGVGAGGLLIAAGLLWFFCFRRRRRSRRRTAAHHAMPSYASDVGVHAMMHDKEMPVVLESSSSSSPPYGSGGGGSHDEERPSTDHYVPYSDRSTTSPTPDHRRTASGTAAAAAAVAAVADVGATSQTRGAPSPSPAIVSRYAHLVEEGMTDDEIRRLEEEERQLDAAIENAGRRGNS